MTAAAISMSLILLAVFGCAKYVLRKEERPLFVAALALKVAAGVAVGFIYLQYFEGGDSQLYFAEAQKIARYCELNDAGILEFLFQEEGLQQLYDQLVFKNQPRALFFNKMVYVLYVIAGGSFWLTCAYFSLLSFGGFWIFYKSIKNVLSISGAPVIIALFFWPSVVFWSSGLIKESISVPLILVSISTVLILSKDKRKWPFLLVVFALSSFFLFKIKYYYAAILVPILVSFYLSHLIKSRWAGIRRKKFLQLVLFISIFSSLALVASNLHYNLRLENVTAVIVKNYYLFESKSEPAKMINFEHLSPNILSLIYYSPKALFSGLFRPNIFDIENVWSALAAFENLLFLALAIFQLKNVKKIKDEHFLLVFVAMFYCGLMAVLLSFSAPNLGTLVRYKAGFLFVLVLIVFHKNPLFKK